MSSNPFKRALMRACTDAGFRAKLVADPKAALAEVGVAVPDDVEVCVHEPADDRLLLVLPAARGAALDEQGLPSGPVEGVPEGLTLEWKDDLLVAEGRLDATTAPALRAELDRCFCDVDIDLSGVKFLGSAGLSALLAGRKHADTNDCVIRLCDVPEPIRNVFEIAGFTELFEFETRRDVDYLYADPLGPMHM